MSAPPTDFPALSASTSSSGYADGFGRRALAFDREDGTMFERLAVRAELSAFGRSLRDRLDRLSAIDDERVAKPRSIERAGDGTLIVLSEYVPGTRLSDLIEETARQGSVPGVDVALGFLLDILPALCGLHAGAGFAHGGLSAGRTVLTPAGQVVMLDAIFGEALSRLQYSRRRLWAEFAIAMPPGPGPARFDFASDVAQAALSAVMLMLGRPVAEHEYPDEITSLLVEVVDVAQIRGTSDFAAGLQRFLQRSLPLPGRRPYTTADDALIEARDLARVLGVDGCRRAFLEFIDQDSGAGTWDRHQLGGEYGGYRFAVDEEPVASPNGAGDDISDPFEVSLDLDLDTPAPGNEAIYDIDPADDVVSQNVVAAAEEPEEIYSAPSTVTYDDAQPVEQTLTDYRPAEMSESQAMEAALELTPVPEPDPAPEPAPELAAAFDEDSRQPAIVEEVPPVDADPFDATSDSDLPSYEDTPLQSPAADYLDSNSSRRRRKQSRSARSRKDKLRSIAKPQPLAPAPSRTPPPPPAPPPAPSIAAPPPPPTPSPAPPIGVAKTSPSGWLVEPNRATTFEPPIPDPTPTFVPAPPPPPRPIAVMPPAPPPVPMTLPPPAPQVFMPQPVFVPTPPPPLPPPIPAQHVPVATSAPVGTVKLKSDASPGFSPQRKPRVDPVEDLYTARPAPPEEAEASAFPWKIASAAIVLLVVAVVAGRWFMQSRAAQPKPPAVVEAPAPVAAPAMAPKMGRIQVETQPPGARVVLDGKPVGESPLTLDVPAGRHTLTLAAASGSVRKTIRVEAGKTLAVDVPIFSGWIEVTAPIILDVSEDGKSIGTTEQNRLLVRPGRHVLTFANRDLDYTSMQTVDIEPGEVKTLTIDPRGTANLNATPWAEVWINGKKIGETPLANLELPLGTHDVVFKHPQFGERRMTTTIRANAPVALSVDMSKQ